MEMNTVIEGPHGHGNIDVCFREKQCQRDGEPFFHLCCIVMKISLQLHKQQNNALTLFVISHSQGYQTHSGKLFLLRSTEQLKNCLGNKTLPHP